MHIVYGSNPESSERVSEKYMQVNGVGSTLEERRDLVTDRPEGRCDYGLLYIDKGWIEFDFGRGYERVEEGTFLLFRPFEPQFYRLKKDEDNNHYWVYFSGTAVESILRGLCLSDKKLIKVGKDSAIIEMYENICRELLYRTPGFEEAINSQIIALLTYAARHSSIIDEIDNPSTCIIVGTMWDERIAQALKLIQINSEHFYTNDELAAMCHLSKYYFCRLFTQTIGMSPHSYILELKLDKARMMLENTGLTVTEIAMKLGFGDVATFSRAFFRKFRTTPSDYRINRKKSSIEQ